MTEQKTKKRAWVKDAAIVFLIILLVLTFFSDTIRNRSLPEVATKAVQSGSVTTQIRGSGVAEAVETFNVAIAESREVKTVAIKTGQTVLVGDVLFILSEAESSELESAKDTLQSLQMQYQKALISATELDYVSENRNIQYATKALQDAIAKRDGLSYDGMEFTIASQAVDAAQANVEQAEYNVELAETARDSAQNRVNTAQSNLDSLGGLQTPNNSTVSALLTQLNEARAALNAANSELETAKLVYGTYYEAVKEAARQWIIDSNPDYDTLTDKAKESYIEKNLPIYMPAVAQSYKDALDDTKNYYTAYTTITDLENSISTLQANYNAIYSSYIDAVGNDNSSTYNKYLNALNDAKDTLTAAENKVTSSKKTLTSLQTALGKAETRLEEAKTEKSEYESEYKAAVSSIESLERELDDLIFSLSQSQKSDAITQQLEALNLQDMRNQIADQQETIERLTKNASETEILSKVDGVVKSVNITAGNTTSYNETMASIEVNDRGYSVSFSVTNEQSKRLAIGDSAEVSYSNYYWGSSGITATLVSMRNDPQNPTTSKQLIFSLSGEVESGSSLNVTVGQRSTSYDLIVPNSAIRSDTNGDFVLIIETKSSPLGDRLIASRVDVRVLASDDTNTAVSGGLSNWDYVITTSNMPLEPGQQVRMAEG